MPNSRVNRPEKPATFSSVLNVIQIDSMDRISEAVENDRTLMHWKQKAILST